MVHYPIAWINLSFIFGLCMVRNVFTQSWNALLCALLALFIFLFIQRTSLKKAIGILLGTLLVFALNYVRLKHDLQGRTKHKIDGIFYFDKVFRTKPQRIGGFGQLYSEHYHAFNPIYIHMGNPQNLKISDKHFYRLTGTLLPLQTPFNSLQSFSYYLWTRGIRYHVTRAHLEDLGKNVQANWIQHLQNTFKNSLKKYFKDPDKAHTYQAILLGKKELLSNENLNRFFFTGTMHLFAVSGLHVGMVCTFLFYLFKLLCFPKLLRLCLTLVGVFIYGSIVSFSPSTLRATYMVSFIILMQLLPRPIDVKAAFLNTACLTLILNPWQLWDVGFQLSYGVVAAILYWGIPAAHWVAQSKFSGMHFFGPCICISLSASMMSALFSSYYWQMITPWAFLTNLFLIPLTGYVVMLGTLGFICSFIFPFALHLINPLSEQLIALLLYCVEIGTHFPAANIPLKCGNNAFYMCLFTCLLTQFTVFRKSLLIGRK